MKINTSVLSEATSAEAASFIRRTPKLRLDANGKDTTESVIDNGENSELQSTANGGIINQNESEGAENVGEQVYNGSQWIRRESGNTESSLGGVQEANGRVSGIAQESYRRQGTLPNLSNQRNNRRITPDQNESLKTTTIKNK